MQGASLRGDRLKSPALRRSPEHEHHPAGSHDLARHRGAPSSSGLPRLPQLGATAFRPVGGACRDHPFHDFHAEVSPVSPHRSPRGNRVVNYYRRGSDRRALEARDRQAGLACTDADDDGLGRAAPRSLENFTVCGPALTSRRRRGVLPSDLPSRKHVDAGIEFTFRNPSPAGREAFAGSRCGRCARRHDRGGRAVDRRRPRRVRRWRGGNQHGRRDRSRGGRGGGRRVGFGRVGRDRPRASPRPAGACNDARFAGWAHEKWTAVALPDERPPPAWPARRSRWP